MRERVSTKLKIRYWWEVYRLLETSPELRAALGLDRSWVKTKKIYSRWGDIAHSGFEAWWQRHHDLFLDKVPAVRLLSGNRFRRRDACIYLECDLKRPPSILLTSIGYHLRSKARELNRTGKGKTNVNAVFSITKGREIRPAAYRDYIRFLKELYEPNCAEPRPMEIRRYAQRLYGAKRGIVSLHLDKADDRTTRAYVAMHRYLNKVRELCRAVAQGRFPN